MIHYDNGEALPYNALAGMEEFLEELHEHDRETGESVLEETVKNLVMQTPWHAPKNYLLTYDEWAYLSSRYLGWTPALLPAGVEDADDG